MNSNVKYLSVESFRSKNRPNLRRNFKPKINFMKKIVLMLACGFGIAASTNAQVMFAPAAGFSLNNGFLKVASEDKEDTKIKMGFRVGGLVALPLTDNLYLMPGIFYSMKGFKENYDVAGVNVEAETSLNYLEVPVNVAYMTGVEGDGRFMVNLGPYIGYAFSGKTKTEGGGMNESEDVEIGNDKAKDFLKPIEIGANVGVGYMLPMGLFGRLDYHHGLTNSVVGGDNKNSYKNYGFGLTVGYFFGGR